MRNLSCLNERNKPLPTVPVLIISSAPCWRWWDLIIQWRADGQGEWMAPVIQRSQLAQITPPPSLLIGNEFTAERVCVFSPCTENKPGSPGKKRALVSTVCWHPPWIGHLWMRHKPWNKARVVQHPSGSYYRCEFETACISSWAPQLPWHTFCWFHGIQRSLIGSK